MISVFCDGGCRGNQFKENIGAWAFYIPSFRSPVEISQATRNTTNNIMEITSCIRALEFLLLKGLDNEQIEIVMDSQYVVTGINEWVYNWQKNGWRTASKKPVENQELWKQLVKLSKAFTDIHFVKCKGHADNMGNNHVDKLVNKSMDAIE